MLRRIVNSQSWWVASELVRRHPELTVFELHPGGGQADCLSLRDSTAPGSWREVIDLNRNGSMKVVGHPAFPAIPIEALLRQTGPHDVLKKLEAGAGLRGPAATPPSNGKALAFRLIAHVLTAQVNDKARWDARCELNDTSGYGSGLRGFIDRIPAARISYRSAAGTVPEYWHFVWALLRGGEPVAIVNTTGQLHVGELTYDLLQIYADNGRRLTPTVSQTLGSILT